MISECVSPGGINSQMNQVDKIYKYLGKAFIFFATLWLFGHFIWKPNVHREVWYIASMLLGEDADIGIKDDIRSIIFFSLVLLYPIYYYS